MSDNLIKTMKVKWQIIFVYCDIAYFKNINSSKLFMKPENYKELVVAITDIL